MRVPLQLQLDLHNLPNGPGVYRMVDRQGTVLYVGKAKNLKHRVMQYFSRHLTDLRLLQMRQQVVDIDITLTSSEAEALWLEYNYIQREKPRYNILLKDDKRYPMLLLSEGTHPALRLYRGPRVPGAVYFGPFPSSLQAKLMLRLLARLFRVRQCKESVYKSRYRPCLQYDLGYCLAPCVAGYVTDEGYQSAIAELSAFLHGNTGHVLGVLTKAMEQASHQQDYEKAIAFRDRIRAIQQATSRQPIQSGLQHSVDILTAATSYGQICVNQLIVREGSVVESSNHFLSGPLTVTSEEALMAFIGQFYLANWGEGVQQLYFPQALVCRLPTDQKKLLEKTFRCATPKLRLSLLSPDSDQTTRALSRLSHLNGQEGLQKRLRQAHRLADQFQNLQAALSLVQLNQIDCFDISHTQGQLPIGACVRLQSTGFDKSTYRAYPLTLGSPGDDPAAIHLAVTKRYAGSAKKSLDWPDVILIDGGKTQLAAAAQALEAIQAPHDLTLLAIAKSPDREPGQEKIYLRGPTELQLPPAAFLLLQQARDEAHRYAGVMHAKKRIRHQRASTLEAVSGIGPKKSRSLITYLGGLRQLTGASIEQIAQVPGISRTLAQKIFDSIHPPSTGQG